MRAIGDKSAPHTVRVLCGIGGSSQNITVFTKQLERTHAPNCVAGADSDVERVGVFDSHKRSRQGVCDGVNRLTRDTDSLGIGGIGVEHGRRNAVDFNVDLPCIRLRCPNRRLEPVDFVGFYAGSGNQIEHVNIQNRVFTPERVAVDDVGCGDSDVVRRRNHPARTVVGERPRSRGCT